MTKSVLSQIDSRIDKILGELPADLRGELRALQSVRDALLLETSRVPLKRTAPRPSGNSEPSLRKVVDEIIRHLPGLAAKEIRAEAEKRTKKKVNPRSISAILSENCKAKKYVNEKGRYSISSAA